MALEVSSYRDLIKLILVIFTVPLVGILSILVYRVQNMGYIDAFVADLLRRHRRRRHLPGLAGAARQPADPAQGRAGGRSYPFSSVAALNTTYFANFGAELAVVSMLPMFFQETWGLNAGDGGPDRLVLRLREPRGAPHGRPRLGPDGQPALRDAGLHARHRIGFALMGLLNSSWPLIIAIAITIFCSFFVQGAEGATFGIIPSIKRRVTGQIAGMAGAYGNVGAVFYLFVFMFVMPRPSSSSSSRPAPDLSWLVCFFWLKEPEGGFGEEYVLSSVDMAIAEEAQRRKDAERDLAQIFEGSQKVALAEKGDGLTVTARFRDLDELRSALARLGRTGQQPAE
jgi:MFS transporter, NNP family, nitrate/nitrite transporter